MHSEIARQRLSNQRIAGAKPEQVSDLVRWMGMIQAQDYLGALWAVGARLQSASEGDIEKALAEKQIVRTWPARGTLHFVAAQDVRWQLELLAQRMITRSQGRYRQLGLDEATFSLSRDMFIRALQGGAPLTRSEMLQVLEMAHISTAGQRGIHILGRLAQEGLICFGPRLGKQQTFVLLDEWAPQAQNMPRDEALVELTRRYFTSHGPATLQDFAWWSGLTMTDARAGVEMAGMHLAQESFGDQTYWFSAAASISEEPAPTAHLLPAFDEYLVGYKDRSAVLQPMFVKQTNAGGGMLSPVVVIDGQVLGTWKRTLKKAAVILEVHWFTEVNPGQAEAFRKAALQYGAFLNLLVDLVEAHD